jgi:hypothetical protein
MGIALSSLERRQVTMPIESMPTVAELARLAHLLVATA